MRDKTADFSKEASFKMNSNPTETKQRNPRIDLLNLSRKKREAFHTLVNHAVT